MDEPRQRLRTVSSVIGQRVKEDGIQTYRRLERLNSGRSTYIVLGVVRVEWEQQMTKLPYRVGEFPPYSI